MAETARHTVEELEEFFDSGNPELVRYLAQRVRALLRGKGNSHFNVTLDPDQTSTVVLTELADRFSQVQWSPQSASAAVGAATGSIWAEATDGVITIHHDNQPDTDRQLAVVLQG